MPRAQPCHAAPCLAPSAAPPTFADASPGPMPSVQVYLDYELAMQTQLWLRPHAEAPEDGDEDGTMSLPVGSNGTRVTAPALRILDSEGRARLGFAAGRGELGLEQYEIHEWWFKRNVDAFRVDGGGAGGGA